MRFTVTFDLPDDEVSDGWSRGPDGVSDSLVSRLEEFYDDSTFVHVPQNVKVSFKGDVMCSWFTLCDRIAVTTRNHPILGDVPICAECNAKVERLSHGGPRQYPQDFCLADIAAYGACILSPGHDGDHKDANGHTFNGVDRKVRS